jgi:hypothetical protein
VIFSDFFINIVSWVADSCMKNGGCTMLTCPLCSFLGEAHSGQSDIFGTLSRIRKMLKGNHSGGKIVHVIEKVLCCAHG